MDQNLAILLANFADGPYFSAFFWCVPISSGSVAIMFVSVQKAGSWQTTFARGSRKQHPLPQPAGQWGCNLCDDTIADPLRLAALPHGPQGGSEAQRLTSPARVRFASAMPWLRRSFRIRPPVMFQFGREPCPRSCAMPGCPRGRNSTVRRCPRSRFRMDS